MLEWEGEDIDRRAARAAAAEIEQFRTEVEGESLVIANEFAEVRVSKVVTRNGTRLLIESPKSGQWVTLDPLELEATTWQNAKTFSAMVGRPFAPMFEADDE